MLREAVLGHPAAAQQATAGLAGVQVCFAVRVYVGGSTGAHLGQHAQPYGVVIGGAGQAWQIRL